MCYMLLIGTDSPEELSVHNDRLVSFSRELPGLPEESLLTLPYKWYLGSVHGCSCGFRHLCTESVSLGFGEPEDWYPEEPENIEATLKVIAIIRTLVGQGANVECIDAWCHTRDSPRVTTTIDVNLAGVADGAFRFFEDHRFVFTADPNQLRRPTAGEK